MSEASPSPCGLQGTPTLEELKLQYYQLLIRYHSNGNSYLDACRCYRAIYDSDSIKDNPDKWIPVMPHADTYGPGGEENPLADLKYGGLPQKPLVKVWVVRRATSTFSG